VVDMATGRTKAPYLRGEGGERDRERTEVV